MRCDKCGERMTLDTEFEFTDADFYNEVDHIRHAYRAMIAGGVDINGKWELWACPGCDLGIFKRQENATANKGDR